MNARSTVTPSPPIACAMLAAASSSEMSPGSSLATTISFDAGLRQRLDFGSADQRALLQHEAVLANAVDRDAADRVGRLHRAELHAGSFTAAASAPFGMRSSRGDLRHDRDGDLGGRDRADRNADRRVNARQRRFGNAQQLQPLDALRMGFARAERADIEAVPSQAHAISAGSSIFGSCVSATNAVYGST